MFNLLVHGNGEAWEEPPFSMGVVRFKEYSGSEADAISIAQPETLRRLQEVPALLMYEVGASGPNPKLVRHGRLSNITRRGGDLTFEFAPDAERGYLTLGTVLGFADALGMHRFEQHRTHWAVKDGDLPPDLLALAIAAPPQRTLTIIAQEYADARERGLRARRLELEQELAALPKSREKAIEILRVLSHEQVIPEAFQYFGVTAGTEEARAAIASMLVLNATPDLPEDWPFTLAIFLDAFGSPTEAGVRDDAIQKCREHVVRLTADGDGEQILWPSVETLASTLWRCARSPLLALQLRRRYGLLLDQLARRQTQAGSWQEAGGRVSVRATAMATVVIQRLGDDKHRERVANAVRKLLEQSIEDGAWPILRNAEEGDVVATTFALEALRRSGMANDIPHVFTAGDAWLMEAQREFGTWQADGWDENAVTTLVLDYLERRSGMLAQVDGFLLMARDFFRKAEEFRLEGGANDRRIAAIATVHAVEMFLYGLFEKRPDLNVSAYRRDGNETVGLREGLGLLQEALRRVGMLTAPQGLAYRDPLSSLASRRDGIIHRAHEISAEELDRGMRAARSFIDRYGAELARLDLLQ
jgi:squalene-hopene cyclase-like protein